MQKSPPDIEPTSAEARSPIQGTQATPTREWARWLPLLVGLGGALLAWLVVGSGFANYDTAYSLVWGSELLHGRLPTFDVPVAPTPHPLATLLGLILAPLGSSAELAWVVIAFLCLGALAAVTFELTRGLFGIPAAVIAAVIVLTREPILSFGARAYIDVPYVVLVLAAVLWESRRRRAGAPVLVLLSLAGLLRPEAWLFAGAYLIYLAVQRESRTRLLKLSLLAAAAPLLWVLTDFALAGDPLFSFTGTQENAEVLQRKTGLVNALVLGPRRLGEIVREPVLLGAVLGLTVAAGSMARRVRLPIGVGVTAGLAFGVLAAANLPILGRYLMLPAVLLIIFCAGALTGWTQLERANPWRNRWIVAGAVTAIALVAFTPAQVSRLTALRNALGIQQKIRDDLETMTPQLKAADCGPVTVPNHRPVPLLALWLNRSPKEIHSAQLERPTEGIYVQPASSLVLRNFTLDKNDPKTLTAEVPPKFALLTQNRSWTLFQHCEVR